MWFDIIKAKKRRWYKWVDEIMSDYNGRTSSAIRDIIAESRNHNVPSPTQISHYLKFDEKYESTKKATASDTKIWNRV
tara:strand:- start:331 stop:564 length:234 start_codon:yes stop_codon:yes gene_type:complete